MDQSTFAASSPETPGQVQVWLAGVAALIIWLAFSRFEIVVHNDDAMRLVQVRDLLAGQGWFDLTQHRLGLEGGTAMHWSRLVDAPIAAIILIAEPFTGPTQAEAAAMVIWPGLLFAGSLFALAAICHRLGGAKAALYGAVIAAILLGQSGKFDPGSLDHHNVQIMLLAAALAGFVYRRSGQRYAALSGAALALALGVGVETLPQLAVVCFAFAAIWALRGTDERVAALGFASAMAVVLTLVFLTATPAEAMAGGFCDALSRDLFLPAMVGAVGLSILALRFSDATRGARFLALIGLAGLAFGSALMLAPACLSNPLDTLDPLLREKWLDRVAETKSIDQFSSERLGFFAGAIVGLLIAIWFMLREMRWEPWTLLSLTIAASLALTAFQSRGFPVLAALSILPTAVLAARLSHPAAKNDRVWATVVMLCALLLSVPAATSALVSGSLALIPRSEAATVEPTGQAEATGTPCTRAADMAELAALPVGVVSAPPYFGAHVLLHTPHRALSAPYHRNQAGMLAQLDLAYAAPEKTEALLKQYGVDYLIVCATDVQFPSENPGLAVHVGPEPSPFLTPLTDGAALTVYQVMQ